MTTIQQTRVSRLNYLSIPSIFMACSAFVLWLYGPDALPLMPWLCLMSALVTTRHIFFEAKFPSLFTWFAVAYIGLFLVYPFVAPLLGIEIPTSNEVFAEYCFLAVAGIQLFIIAYECGTSRPVERHWDVRYQTTSGRLFNVICLLVIINIIAILLVIADAGSFSAIQSQTRLEIKLHVGPLRMLGVYLLGLGSLLYPLIAIHVRCKRSRTLVWLPVIVGFEIFLFLAFRTRTHPVMHTVGLLVGWFIIAPRMVLVNSNRPNHRLRTRLTMVQKITLVGFAVTLTMGMFVLRIFRGHFEQAESLSEIEIDIVGSVRYAFEGGGELGHSRLVFRILELVPEEYGYLKGQSYYRLLFVPIPRSVWPDKPFNSQRIMAQWINPGTVSVQTTPVGIIGDLYVNFGMWGILGMLAFGYAFGRIDRITNLSCALVLAVSFAMVFHLVRGGFTNPILTLVVYFMIAHYCAAYLTMGMRREGAPTSLRPVTDCGDSRLAAHANLHEEGAPG